MANLPILILNQHFKHHWNYIDVSKTTSFSENSIILGGAQGQLTHVMNSWGGAQGQLTLTMQSDETMWIAWISSSHQL